MVSAMLHGGLAQTVDPMESFVRIVAASEVRCVLNQDKSHIRPSVESLDVVVGARKIATRA